MPDFEAVLACAAMRAGAISAWFNKMRIDFEQLAAAAVSAARFNPAIAARAASKADHHVISRNSTCTFALSDRRPRRSPVADIVELARHPTRHVGAPDAGAAQTLPSAAIR